MSCLDDDPFSATRMSLGDHIEELRLRLWKALVGFGVALILGFFLSPSLLRFIAAPVDAALAKFHQRRIEHLLERLRDGDPQLRAANQPRDVELMLPARRLAQMLGLSQEKVGSEWLPLPVRIRPMDWALLTGEAMRLVHRPPSLMSLTITEPFTVYFKVSAYCGIVLASPWIVYQLWLFVAAGLYPHEKRLVHVALPLSIVLFLGGVALCEFVVLPTGVDYLLSFNDWLGYEPEPRLSDWLSFALLMPLVFGVAFQTPLVMVFLERIGVFSVEGYRRNRRVAVFLLAVLAAVISVTPDYYSMLALTVPLWGLYEVGILLCRWSPRSAGEPEEIVV
ncbi:MAG TPA: twin-arginine translocase subunit TatC [Gemmataceae bacterium]|nr:twin-arginine translocase subunit TatC [Gemmataceae bacterium]